MDFIHPISSSHQYPHQHLSLSTSPSFHFYFCQFYLYISLYFTLFNLLFLSLSLPFISLSLSVLLHAFWPSTFQSSTSSFLSTLLNMYVSLTPSPASHTFFPLLLCLVVVYFTMTYCLGVAIKPLPIESILKAVVIVAAITHPCYRKWLPTHSLSLSLSVAPSKMTDWWACTTLVLPFNK